MVNPSLGVTVKNNEALPSFFGRYRGIVSESLRLAFPGSEVDVLYTMLRHHLGWVDPEGRPIDGSTGKALRPVLCLLACQAVGGEVEQALPAAAALELIHNFSLIHDDIQDGDKERHGRATAWWIWGRPKALVAGNAMRVLADMTLWGMLREGVSYPKSVEVSRLLSQSYMEMIEGQFLDMRFEESLQIGVNDYNLLISLKTGALIRCALELGAYVGTDDPGVRRAMRGCGEALGAAFQIRDDYLGVWGDEWVTGKAVGADIYRKKKSFPVVYALENSGGDDKRRLKEIYSNNTLDQGDVTRVLEIMEGVGAKEHSERLTQAKSKEALEALKQANLSSEAWKDFHDLAEFLVTRTH